MQVKEKSNANKAVARLGEKRVMRCGEEAEIIRYANAHDIDVRFSDGSISYHKEYRHFKNGTIKHPNIRSSVEYANAKDRIGEKRMMNCGDTAEIIAYRNAQDIDVRFTDGTIMGNRTYSCFCCGKIQRPDLPDGRTVKEMKQRLGAENVMNNGRKAKIIAYRNATDIDIQFEDGAVVEHTTYRYFTTGSIEHPVTGKVFPRSIRQRKERLGKTALMNCGLAAKIIRYGDVNDIDLQFEDGSIIRHRIYKGFRDHEIACPSMLGKTFYGYRLIKRAFRTKTDAYFYWEIPGSNEIDILTPREIMARAGVKPVF